MREEIKARYRNKLSKIIIEVWNGEKWLYVKTLSDPLKEFQAECLAKVSLSTGQNKEKDSKKFAYDCLSEPLKQDTSNIVSIEGKVKSGMSENSITLKELQDAQNKLMKDLL